MTDDDWPVLFVKNLLLLKNFSNNCKEIHKKLV